jgi:hypothetical protein
VEAELRVRLSGDSADGEQAMLAVLRTRAAGFALLKRRVIAPGREKAELRLTYRVLLAAATDEEPLVRTLQAVPGVVEAALALESATTSVAGGDDD